MGNQSHVINAIYSFISFEVKGFDSLAELTPDISWSWNHSADESWKQPDSSLWELTHNPWIVIQTVSRDRLKQILSGAHPFYSTGPGNIAAISLKP